MRNLRHQLVSVLLPIYDDANYLEDSIRTILEQDYPHIELIILNRNPSSGDKIIIEKFKDSRIFYYEESIDAQTAILRLFQKAKGEYIKFFCPDDVMLPNCISQLLYKMHEGYQLVFSNMYTMSESGSIHTNDLLFSTITSHPEILENLLSRNTFLYPTSLIIKSYINESFFDLRYKQNFDLKMWINSILKFNLNIGIVNQPLVAYRLRKNSGNMSSKFDLDKVRSLVYEQKQLIQDICFSLTTKQFIYFFPEGARLLKKNQKLTKNLVPLVLAVYFLKYKKDYRFYGIPLLTQFAIDTIFSSIQDEKIERFLIEELKFKIGDLKETFNVYFKNNKVSLLNKYLKMLHLYQKYGIFLTLRKIFFYWIRM